MDLLLKPGTALVAAPQLLDPNFHHTVVLMCDHTKEGAYGLVVNNPTGFFASRLFDEHPLLGDLEHLVMDGGPVGRDHLQILHRLPVEIPGGVEIATL